MSDATNWLINVPCVCGHPVHSHDHGEGRCESCACKRHRETPRPPAVQPEVTPPVDFTCSLCKEVHHDDVTCLAVLIPELASLRSRLDAAERLAAEWTAYSTDKFTGKEWKACRAECARALRAALGEKP